MVPSKIFPTNYFRTRPPNPCKVLHVPSVPLEQPFIEIILFLLVIAKVRGSPVTFCTTLYVLSIVHLLISSLSPELGQTRDNQINCLDPILNRLLNNSSKPFKWTFQNGYIFMTNEDFKIINEVLKDMKKEEKEELKSLLEVGIHWNVEINDNSVMVSRSIIFKLISGSILDER